MRKSPTQKWYVFLLLPLFLASCSFPLPGIGRPTPPTKTPIPSPTPTATIGYTQCYWNWATEALPEVTVQVQAAMDAALAVPVTATAEAYGEDCIDSATNEVAYFAAMETDFRVTVQVDGLGDREALGELAEQILVVLDGFPTESTPGPQPGYVGITFVAGTEELRLWFTQVDGESARALGLHGAALLDELENR
jgi:hypothetical protein